MKLPLLIAAAALTLTLTGCGNIAENAVERAVEGALSSEGVDVNLDDGSVKIESSEGAAEFQVTDQLPADWPSDIPTPEGYTLQSVTSSDTKAEKAMQTTWIGPANDQAGIDAYRAALTAGGWTEGEGAMSGGGMFTVTKGNREVLVLAAPGESETSMIITSIDRQS